ncbi:hypothetical protein AXG93_3810s1290 [Marchantia polymorpha subsp. ruderalis]|uniref:Uncharacterized protein n=1 Tax=Marchantia polymorpha subsp. ruderalis TaxID=1480154 RepID=A0A176VCL4_MARPO|nr:hypothetical protein AXG93_3810s1290 [Marchantia polymorpha subsp. ruderalis]
MTSTAGILRWGHDGQTLILTFDEIDLTFELSGAAGQAPVLIEDIKNFIHLLLLSGIGIGSSSGDLPPSTQKDAPCDSGAPRQASPQPHDNRAHARDWGLPLLASSVQADSGLTTSLGHFRMRTHGPLDRAQAGLAQTALDLGSETVGGVDRRFRQSSNTSRV